MTSKQLSPVGEYLESTRKKLQSNPLSLSAAAYRETIAQGPEMLANEAEFARACYMEGYKKALEDIKENFDNAKNNEKEPREVNK
jgi:hypothetical protein